MPAACINFSAECLQSRHVTAAAALKTASVVMDHQIMVAAGQNKNSTLSGSAAYML